jgi:hypothetical protein
MSNAGSPGESLFSQVASPGLALQGPCEAMWPEDTAEILVIPGCGPHLGAESP